MNLNRHLDLRIQNHLAQRKEIAVLLGARQVGKTTLLQRLVPKAKYFILDNEQVRRVFERYDISAYRQALPEKGTVVLDEVQLLSNPGRAAKIIFDQMPKIRLIITGSSSFEIKNRSTESLAGRKIDYHLYPLSLSEYLFQKGISQDLFRPNFLKTKGTGADNKVYSFDLRFILEELLVFGTYPFLVSHPADGVYLQNLVETVVFKDLLNLNLIENRAAAINLLKLLAYQIGQLVNVTELSNQVGLDAKTVRRYLRFFEESFLVFPLYPFSKRGRDEIIKMPKIYFYDLGLRNALIGNFTSVAGRGDRGALFENFIICEAWKANYYFDLGFNLNFWRTKQGAEIDLVLSKNEELLGIEVKSGKESVTRSFKARYPSSKIKIVTPENFF